MPIFKLIEGAKGSPYPYTPKVLTIPAGRKVALDVTDNIGGCALVTVFPDLGANGGAVRASVPVGQTRRIVILAAKPGRYPYHCSENMFFGEIDAR
jgi:plastocyanin domain-containing protein